MATRKKKESSANEEVFDTREAELQAIIGSMKSKYGAHIVRTPDDKDAIDARRVRMNVISTGSIGFDRLTGVGGIPAGRVLEIRGAHGKFKTGILLCLSAQAQKAGYFVVFVDAEHRLDIDRAAMLGVDVSDEKKFLLITPETGEGALSLVESLSKSINKVFFIIDSVSALLPESDLKKTMDGGNAQMGSQAKLISTALKRLVSSISKSDSILAFTNQHRTQMSGVLTWRGASGGNALGYYDTYILEVKWPSDKAITDSNGDQIGQYVELVMEKNSTDFPKRSRLVPIHLARGFWKVLEILDIGQELGFIKRGGGYYQFVNINKDGDPEKDEEGEFVYGESIQGQKAVLELLSTDKEIFSTMDRIIRKELGILSGD